MNRSDMEQELLVASVARVHVVTMRAFPGPRRDFQTLHSE